MRAGRSCLPARARPRGAYSRRPCRCTPSSQAGGGSRPGPAGPTGPEGSLPGPARSRARSGRRPRRPHRACTRCTPPAVARLGRCDASGRELRIPTASCRLSYAVQRRLHVIDPPRSAGHARREQHFPWLAAFPPPPPPPQELAPAALFGSFFGTTPRSDFPRPWLIVVRPKASRCALRQALSRAAAAGRGISRFPCKVLPRVRGVSDRAGSMPASPMRQARCGLRFVSTASAPRSSRALAPGHGFRGSIPGPHVPLSTLRPHPHECARMTRGRRGWLNLQRMTLSFTTSRRF